MKRIWHHPEETDDGKHYWRSANELSDTPEFRDWLTREFPQGSAEMADGEDAEVSRRNFMKLMGAATSLAGFGMAACRRPEAYLVPYSQSAEWIVPGKPLLYATAMPRLGGCSPLVVTTHEGRPTHLSGNKLHPENGNGTDGFAQASILDLYDPERSKEVIYQGEVPTSREKFEAAFSKLKAEHVAKKGEGLALLVGESTSPTRARLLAELENKLPEAKVYRYESINLDHVRKANTTAYGDGVVQVPRFDKAKRVVSFDCDFLGLDRVTTNAGAEFMAGRQVDDGAVEGMNRLYSVEANYTLTGGMADHRLRVDVHNVAAAALGLARELGVAGAEGQVDLPENDQKWLKEVAADLKAHRGESLVVAGSLQSEELHLLVAAINNAIGAVGKTLDVLQGGGDTLGTLDELVAAIGEKRVSTLLITGDADPVYDAPADLLWGAAQKDVNTVIHFGTRRLSQTAKAATWHVPGAHYLESWGDVRAADGTYSIVQPMILPLYGGVSEIEVILSLLDDEVATEEGAEGAVAEESSAAYEAVRKTFESLVAGDAGKAWNLTLRDGFLANSGYPKASIEINGSGIPEVKPAAGEGYSIAFRPDSKVWDGRHINNAWQQEAPDPITKLTWDNAALVSLATASALGIERDGQVIEVQAGEAKAYFPVIQAPGHADNTITVPVGYGQGDVGNVGGGVGFNANPLRSSSSPYVTSGARVTVLSGDVENGEETIPAFHRLATTAEHQNMYGRALVREGTAERLKKNPGFAKKEGMDSHIPENISLYKQTNEAGEVLERNEAGVLVNDKVHQWGMTIDLNQCIGCTACLLSCQSENNIPIVGKEQVLIHREMHWIRMDRYFATADPKKDKKTQNPNGTEAWRDEYREHFENPEMVFQPVACQQCELAPCETVCPVNATVHTEDGLNAMAYNRCIGTRYCANNCPYKARRFNFFDYNKRPLDELAKGPFSSKEKTGVRESLKLQKNPNVTVRMRGVMEKCTYCVQRIQESKISQSQVARDSSAKQVPTNAIKTACQESCPTEAIQFGNLLNPDDDVTKAKASPRNYDLLSYIGARPRTSYLARIKNPNKKIEELTNTVIGEISKHIH